MVEKLRVGVISSVHGIHGECKVFPTTDDPVRFKKLKNVYAVAPSGEETSLQVRTVRFFKNMVICGFDGIETPEEIRKYRGFDLFIDRADAVPLRKGEYYIADLIGLSVIDEDGNTIGMVDDIFPTGANQVMQVKSPAGKEYLIPYISQCILGVDFEKNCINVHILKGLLDL